MQYSLPPDKLQRAIEYAHAGYRLHFVSELWAIVILTMIIASGLSARFRDWAGAVSKRRLEAASAQSRNVAPTPVTMIAARIAMLRSSLPKCSL